MGTWNSIDGKAMFSRFGIELPANTDADRFAVKSSAARYLGIATALLIGVFLVDAVAAAATALMARLWPVLERSLGVAQSSLMFLAPGSVSLIWLLS